MPVVLEAPLGELALAGDLMTPDATNSMTNIQLLIGGIASLAVGDTSMASKTAAHSFTLYFQY